MLFTHTSSPPLQKICSLKAKGFPSYKQTCKSLKAWIQLEGERQEEKTKESFMGRAFNTLPAFIYRTVGLCGGGSPKAVPCEKRQGRCLAGEQRSFWSNAEWLCHCLTVLLLLSACVQRGRRHWAVRSLCTSSCSKSFQKAARWQFYGSSWTRNCGTGPTQALQTLTLQVI